MNKADLAIKLMHDWRENPAPELDSKRASELAHVVCETKMTPSQFNDYCHEHGHEYV